MAIASVARDILLRGILVGGGDPARRKEVHMLPYRKGDPLLEASVKPKRGDHEVTVDFKKVCEEPTFGVTASGALLSPNDVPAQSVVAVQPGLPMEPRADK